MASKKVGSLFVGLGLSTEEFAKGIKDAEKGLKAFGRNVGKIGTEISKNLSLPAAGIVGGVALLTRQYDKALQGISRKTGQTGKDLKELQGILIETFANGGDSINEVADALGTLAQKTGITGVPLKKLTETILDLTDVTGTELNTVVNDSISVFKRFGVSVNEQVPALDFLYKVGQQTGIGFESLAISLGEFAVPLKTLGFGLKESALLVGNLGKAGLDTEKVINGMKLSVAKFIDAGLDPQVAFQQLIDKIKNTDEASGNLLAKAATNNKVFLEFANAVRSGAFELGTLNNKLGETGGAIKTTAQKTEDIGQKLSKIFNPISATLSEAGNNIYKSIIPALDLMISVIQDATKWIRENASGFLEWTLIIASFVAVIGPALLAIKGIAFVIAGALNSALVLATLAINGAVVGFGLLLTPVGLVTAALITGAVVWYKYGDAISHVANDLIAEIDKEINQLAAKLTYLTKFLSEVASGNLSNPREVATQAADTFTFQVAAIKAYNDSLIKLPPVVAASEAAIAELKKGFGELTGSVVGAIKPTGDVNDLLGDLNGTAGLQKKKIAELTKTWQEYTQGLADSKSTKTIETGLEAAIENVDQSAFDSLKAKLEKSLTTAKFNELKNQFGELGNDPEWQAQAEEQAKQQSQAWGDKMVSKQEEVYKQGVDFWANTFENAITGVKFDLKDMLQQVAVGFAAEMAQALLGGPGGITSPQGLGKAIFGELLGGSGGSSLAKDALSEVGIDFGTAASGVLGESAKTWGLTAGTAMGIGAVAYIYGSNMLKNGFDDFIKGDINSQNATDAALSSNLMTAWINPLLDAFGMESVGNMFGSPNKETQARKAFANAIKDMVDQIANGSILMKDSFGEWKNWSGDFFIKGGSGKFNPGNGGFDFFNSTSPTSQNAFGAVGAGLKDKLGLSDLDSSQAAALLSENLGGSIDNLRQLVFALKLDFKDLSKIILDSAEKGTIKWSEFNAQIAGLEEAFKPGLVAIGDIKGAVDELKASGGRGMGAVKGVKDIAQELIESGVTKLDQISAILQQQGYSVEEANAIMRAFIDSGAGTLEEIVNSTTEFAGRIAGNIEGLGFKYDEISASVQDLYKNIKSIDDIEFAKKVLEVVVNISGDQVPQPNKLGGVYGNIEMFAKGGVVGSPTLFKHSTGLGLMGEAGPEAILPLERIGGKLGVNASFNGGKAGGTVNFNIDARGADNGVEERLQSLMYQMGNQIASQTLTQVADMISRGQI